MTKIINVNDKNAITEALKVLKAGGVILYPTDTQYGLGAIATNTNAIQKVRNIKRQGNDKPISIAVSDLEMVEKYANVSDTARDLANKHLPGALTMILRPKQTELNKNLSIPDEVGTRIPDYKFVLDLVKELGEPITSTSANITGQKLKTNVKEILEDLEANRASLNKTQRPSVDLAIDDGELTGEGSTIVDATSNNLKIIRQGKVEIGP